MRLHRIIPGLLLLLLAGCGGADYMPVYFPGTGTAPDRSPPPPDKNPPTSQARCELKLTARLCVKIRGEKIEVGTKPEDPLCADTPEIPIIIEGEKVTLKGTDFPDIQVNVNVKGVQTPMMINGKGSGDGSRNVGQGSWTPEGELRIRNFSFFINVLGISGEIPSLELTTATAKKVPDLPDIQGASVDAGGKVALVTSTVLGHLFEAADKFLLGASMQATFTGTVTPPLAECAQATDSQPQIRVVKLRLDSVGKLSEEALPEGKILEVSTGTTIAQGPEDVGPSFEAFSNFKAINESDKTIQIDLPAHTGSFYLAAEGKTSRTLAPRESFKFRVTFAPNRNNTLEAGTIKQNVRMGLDIFVLSGVALEPKGSVSINRADESGNVTAQNINVTALNPLSVPAGTVRNFFKCQKTKCDGREALTRCETCTPPNTQGCILMAVTSENRAIEEVDAQCKPAHPEALPMMGIDLAGTAQSPVVPSRQILTLHNKGVAPLVVEKIALEEVLGSRSTGQFQIVGESILVGTSLKTAKPAVFPVTLPPYQKDFEETVVYLTAAYLPTDLIGFDGKRAQIGLDVIDKVWLKITPSADTRTLALMGRTRIQEVPQLQVAFGTATGLKPRANNENFAMEEVTATTEDLAIPAFLKLADTATGGLRITDIRIEGKDASFFEWLDTPADVAARQPASGKGKRCSIPVFDPATGRLIDERFDLSFVTPGRQGFDMKPGAIVLSNLPLFGCVNFHREPSQKITQRLFQADLNITTVKLDPQGNPERNADNSFKQSIMTVHLVAAIDPIRGKMVLRISQTVAAILNPTAPSLTAMAAYREAETMMKEGRSTRDELGVMLGAMILDPFDEMEIKDGQGEVVSLPGDGITAVFRAIDTRPTPKNYENEYLFDYATLTHDSELTGGRTGIFYDYDFPEHPLPQALHVNGWRIFTGALSYPGPLSPRSPISRSDCDVIDPCNPEDVRKFTKSGVGADDRGACAFFFGSGGRFDSPAFEPVIEGKHVDLCATRDKPQDLLAMNTGHYSVDGSVSFEDVGLRFWGPTYFHNPGSPLDSRFPLDEIFHIAFTTEMLKPKSGPSDYGVLPEERIDIAKQQHKMNLTEAESGNPPICSVNTRNRTIGGRKYSTWRYFAPLLFKDESGETKAGCPEAGTDFTGGTAFLKGRRLDPATGVFTLVSAGRFSSKEELSLAFKDVGIFIVLNGWLCNPQGNEKNFEGSKCFEAGFNERDAAAHISIMDE